MKQANQKQSMTIIREFFPNMMPLMVEIKLDQHNVVRPENVKMYPLLEGEDGEYTVGEHLAFLSGEDSPIALLYNKRIKEFPNSFNLDKNNPDTLYGHHRN